MLSSLRSKLVLSHFLVILAAFLLTALIASVPIRRVQEARLQTSLALSSETAARQIDLARFVASDSDLGTDSNQIDLAQRVLTSEQQRSENRLLLLDSNGRVILDSEPGSSLLNQNIPSLVLAIDRLTQRIGTRPPPGRATARVAMVLETHSIPAGTLEGRDVTLAATGATALQDRTNIYVAAVAPRRSAPLIDDFVRPLALASIAGLAVSIVIGLLISRTVTRPLRQLTDSVGSLGASDLDARVNVDAKGEVGTLVAAFNDMLDRLASTYTSQRELLANIAHELRTPLTSIRGYAQALRDGVISGESARNEALGTITDEARRMTELVEQILQLSRLESGQLPTAFRDVEVGQLLARIERQFSPIATDRGVELTVDTSSALRHTLDEALILQALGNLMSNAIRHTPSGGSVEARAARVSTTGREPVLRFTVRDTGQGMSDAELERVFDRFYRAGDHSAHHDARNFGLGLAIVDEIVNRHGGEISVQSALGEGTVFAIDLPARASTEASASN